MYFLWKNQEFETEIIGFLSYTQSSLMLDTLFIEKRVKTVDSAIVNTDLPCLDLVKTESCSSAAAVHVQQFTCLDLGDGFRTSLDHLVSTISVY